MFKIIFIFLLPLFWMGPITSLSSEEFLEQRRQLLLTESEMMIGGNLVLSHPKETQVNDILMEFKRREFKEGVDSNGNHFAAAQHFFHSKERIESSPIFKIIKLLPKGCALHLHMTAPQIEFVVQRLSYMDNLYCCQEGLSQLTFHFFEGQPQTECSVNRNWTLVSDLRGQSSSDQFVDSWFFKQMSLFTPQPEVDHPNINEVWRLFDQRLNTMSGIIDYVPAHKEYFLRTLQEFYDDNVQYIELRSSLTTGYNLDQTLMTPIEILEMYQNLTHQFSTDHPDFGGLKFIYSPHRFLTPQAISVRISEAVEMKEKFPDFFIGFDLVGQEDLGTPLLGYLPELLEAAGKNVKFFFHAGETAWHGTKIDENLYDAILLNATRLGHAYALSAHPLLTEMVKEEGIAVESCPISNQVLKLVDDFRNHPIIPLMKSEFPLVIASDDPGIWGAVGLSHDWYVTFMALAGAHSDLRFLKQLALNSIQYSAMTPDEKTLAFSQWDVRWEEFLDQIIAMYASGEFNN